MGWTNTLSIPSKVPLKNHLNISKAVCRVKLTVNTEETDKQSRFKSKDIFVTFRYMFSLSITFTLSGKTVSLILDMAIYVRCECYVRYRVLKKKKVRS